MIGSALFDLAVRYVETKTENKLCFCKRTKYADLRYFFYHIGMKKGKFLTTFSKFHAICFFYKL